MVGMIKEAIALHGKPEIINSDQGCQFTSEAYTALFRKGGVAEGIRISMDGKGRAIDNVFIERFWRTLKHEYRYLAPPTDVELNRMQMLYPLLQRKAQALQHRENHTSRALQDGCLKDQQTIRVLSLPRPLKRQHQQSHTFDQSLS